MYEDLVEALRLNVEYRQADNALANAGRAADAIEDLEFACNRYEKDYKALCEYLPKWIPVAERLPEDGQWVLCMCRAEIIDVLKYSNGINGPWYKDSRHVFMKRFVTHWMPLPEPPKENEK